MASIDFYVGQERTCEAAKPSKNLKGLAAVVDQVSRLAFIEVSLPHTIG
jgi:hypothetical protein